MGTFNIKKGSLALMGDSKVGMTVTFKAKDGREVTQYHEVESTDKDVIEAQLQTSADEFEARSAEVVAIPKLTEGKDTSVVLKEPVLV